MEIKIFNDKKSVIGDFLSIVLDPDIKGNVYIEITIENDPVNISIPLKELEKAIQFLKANG